MARSAGDGKQTNITPPHVVSIMSASTFSPSADIDHPGEASQTWSGLGGPMRWEGMSWIRTPLPADGTCLLRGQGVVTVGDPEHSGERGWEGPVSRLQLSVQVIWDAEDGTE
ncbi:hypothetical protein Bbelb_145360 [Branchiostoma belcheri]|nr:hypothetical protein Bbelb_431010 [Branchiostoma belcheri]KAI8508296.1 hypothetical protein Bbelb_145360 [Branchiostoma belcheri]